MGKQKRVRGHLRRVPGRRRKMRVRGHLRVRRTRIGRR